MLGAPWRREAGKKKEEKKRLYGREFQSSVKVSKSCRRKESCDTHNLSIFFLSFFLSFFLLSFLPYSHGEANRVSSLPFRIVGATPSKYGEKPPARNITVKGKTENACSYEKKSLGGIRTIKNDQTKERECQDYMSWHGNTAKVSKQSEEAAGGGGLEARANLPSSSLFVTVPLCPPFVSETL
jgi:hypothetical protein